MEGDFESFSGRIKGNDALLTLLLPILAVSVGMTVFAVIFNIVT